MIKSSDIIQNVTRVNSLQIANLWILLFKNTDISTRKFNQQNGIVTRLV